MNTLIETLSFFWEIPGVRAVAIVVASIVLALVLKFVVIRLLISLTKKTKTELDDRIISALRFPLFITAILLGLSYAAYDLELSENVLYYVLGVLKTAAVLIWGQAAMHIGSVFLQLLSRLTDRVQFIQPSSLPLFEIVVKVVVVVAFGYFFMAAWGINVTGWLASAGILGIAIGFAAKDTLANLFAGIFILTDAPYRIGDFIVLGDNRGMVTHIGIRSTRILTRDDIEITIPNASIANSQIINETSGRHKKCDFASPFRWPMAAMCSKCAGFYCPAWRVWIISPASLAPPFASRNLEIPGLSSSYVPGWWNRCIRGALTISSTPASITP